MFRKQRQGSGYVTASIAILGLAGLGIFDLFSGARRALQEKQSMFERIGRFFSPARTSPLWVRIMPYAFFLFPGITVFLITGAGWEYTQQQCVLWNRLPHHAGRVYLIPGISSRQRQVRRVPDRSCHNRHPVDAQVKRDYPRTQVCGRRLSSCPSTPSRFGRPLKSAKNATILRSSRVDSLTEFKHYDAERNNEETLQYMAFKTGGGTDREGRGKGIHWHIENDIEYISTDDPHLEQEIPVGARSSMPIPANRGICRC